ncbi:hypothetical protein TIFTF001_029854 [Ficus carica]|uniref:Uncharacterized protein n=1 Tax=Ficus carica TaxID=3494 RepID=A0AA88DSJ4_FICCA|nr:hypothetical protein TIFTF001_029854 [Ficus carica]
MALIVDSIVMEMETNSTVMISMAIQWSQISAAIPSPSHFLHPRLPILADSSGRIFGREEQVLLELMSGTGVMVT